jgi:hypothetical protein
MPFVEAMTVAIFGTLALTQPASIRWTLAGIYPHKIFSKVINIKSLLFIPAQKKKKTKTLAHTCS